MMGIQLEKKQTVIMRDGWEDEGKIGTVLGEVFFAQQHWTPILWDGEEDPSFHKTAGLKVFERKPKNDLFEKWKVIEHDIANKIEYTAEFSFQKADELGIFNHRAIEALDEAIEFLIKVCHFDYDAAAIIQLKEIHTKYSTGT